MPSTVRWFVDRVEPELGEPLMLGVGVIPVGVQVGSPERLPRGPTSQVFLPNPRSLYVAAGRIVRVNVRRVEGRVAVAVLLAEEVELIAALVPGR